MTDFDTAGLVGECRQDVRKGRNATVLERDILSLCALLETLEAEHNRVLKLDTQASTNWQETRTRLEAGVDAYRSRVIAAEAERDAALRRADAAEADAKSRKHDIEMYINAWRRSLGNKLFNKRHLIDALVMTTEHLQQNYVTWKNECDAIQERRDADLQDATLGIVRKPPALVEALALVGELQTEVRGLREGILDIYTDMEPSALKARLGAVGSKYPKSRQPTVDVEAWLAERKGNVNVEHKVGADG